MVWVRFRVRVIIGTRILINGLWFYDSYYNKFVRYIWWGPWRGVWLAMVMFVGQRWALVKTTHQRSKKTKGLWGV